MSDITLSADYKKKLNRAQEEAIKNNLTWESVQFFNIRQEIKESLLIEQNGTCAYCKAKIITTSCEIDHIAPKSIYHDFLFHPKNLCVICMPCNRYKSNLNSFSIDYEKELRVIGNKNPRQYPRSSKSFKILNPHFNDYKNHISIKEDENKDKYYIGITSKGHNTIGICKINIRSFSKKVMIISLVDYLR